MWEVWGEFWPPRSAIIDAPCKSEETTMISIETTGTATANGELTVILPADLPPGEYKVAVVIDETPLPPKQQTPKGPLKLNSWKWENWPADCRFSRADIYGDYNDYGDG